MKRKRAEGTHELESASGWTGQDMERKGTSEGQSQAGERIEKDWSGHEKEASERHSQARERIGMDWLGDGKKMSERRRRALTGCRAHQDEVVRTWKERKRVRGTHSLETASG
jgi:hypothetical protein